jgi:putative heme iron utilization protein
MSTSEKSQHAGGGEASPTAHVPEPSFAERARTLVHLGRTATLSTHSAKVPGYPFGSVSMYGVDAQGRPTFLISALAMHTHNLDADGRASLLVTQPNWNEDPLAGSRVTLVGDAAPVPEADQAAVRDAYLARHDNARFWVDYGDFRFYRMQVANLYYVAGFGAMGWVAASEYTQAAVDPLADSAPGMLEHMNADHADALALYCKAFAGVAADAATMTAVDRLGFRVRARTGERLQGLRINFPREITSVSEARQVLVEMVAQARQRA